MLSVSKQPRPKHAQLINNPGFSKNSKPVIKIKAKVSAAAPKKGGKRRTRKQKRTRSARKSKKSRKTTKRRTRKAGSHSTIGR
jgi:hypothetical protein